MICDGISETKENWSIFSDIISHAAVGVLLNLVPPEMT